MTASSGASRPLGHVDAVGRYVMGRGRALARAVDFLGLTVIALFRLATGRSRASRRAFAVAFQESGVETLPVVAVMSAASGGVLSLLAAQQLDKLGAPMLAPKLTGIAILSELGALITGIAVAGRVASALRGRDRLEPRGRERTPRSPSRRSRRSSCRACSAWCSRCRCS